MQLYDPLTDAILEWLYLIVLILTVVGLGAKIWEETPGEKDYDPT